MPKGNEAISTKIQRESIMTQQFSKSHICHSFMEEKKNNFKLLIPGKYIFLKMFLKT